jgi:hypothetical protein
VMHYQAMNHILTVVGARGSEDFLLDEVPLVDQAREFLLQQGRTAEMYQAASRIGESRIA